MDEKEAKVLDDVIVAINRCQPLVAILENVYGFLRVLGQAKDKFEEGGLMEDYFFAILRMDPKRFGEPVTRRRIYLCFLRKILGTTIIVGFQKGTCVITLT
ncbi:unnamed protein product [Durusdinium trenchii]|uniref:DNA (cytosine-5-)-methyltransferase n=1 Tax=Durusdinium trenchii TaxID=1381693 RepID=A0ABP0PE99_9DINO